MAIKGLFADGSPMLAIPDFARMKRVTGTPLPPREPAPGPDGMKPEPPPVVSRVWIKEGA